MVVRSLARFARVDLFPLLRRTEATYGMFFGIVGFIGVIAARLGLGPAGVAVAVLSAALVLSVVAGVRLRRELDHLHGDPNPPPFDLEFGESYTPDAAGVVGQKFNLRLPVTKNGDPAKCRAYLIATDGDRDSKAHIPLAWANEDDPEITLSSDAGTEINIGAFNREPDDRVLSVRPRKPGSTAEFHKPIYPPAGAASLSMWFEVRHSGTGQAARHGLRVSFGDDGNPMSRPIEPPPGDA